MSPPSYHAYNQLSAAPDHMYKLIQLPKDLLEVLETAGNELVIKASPSNPNSMALCTASTTWKMRQMNHSNTVLLLKNTNIDDKTSLKHLSPSEEGESSNNLVGFSSHSYEYELSNSPGHIHIDNVPVFSGKSIKSSQTVAHLLENSLISTLEFFAEWYALCGCEIDGKAVILSADYVTEALGALILLLISHDVDYTDSDYIIDQTKFSSLLSDLNYAPEVVTTLLHKFGRKDPEQDRFSLQNPAIATWYGIQTLRATGSVPVAPKDFLLKWKSSFPPFYNVPIDLGHLQGHFARPLPDRIQHLSPSSLTKNDVSARFKELFQFCKEWDFDDFVAYIQEFIPAGKKPDSVILKYAKKKRVGKKFVVCPR